MLLDTGTHCSVVSSSVSRHISNMGEPTLGDVWKSMQLMHEKMDSYQAEIKDLRNKVENVENSQAALNEKISAVEKSAAVKKDVAECEDRLKEEIDRIRRSSNLILFGVQETEEGILLAERVLKLLLPDHTGKFLMRRYGVPPSDDSKTRPLQVCLNSAAERSFALSNKKLLKGKDEFARINVQADRTKKQRMEKPPPPPKTIVTRSETRKEKRSFEVMNGSNGSPDDPELKKPKQGEDLNADPQVNTEYSEMD